MEMDVSNRITSILDYYSKNKGCDPNVYEFFDVCDSFASYINKAAPNYGIYATINKDGVKTTLEEARNNYPIAAAVFDKFNLYEREFSKKLLNNNLGINKESPLYLLCNDSYLSSIRYAKRSDIELRKKIGAVALYIAQQKREVVMGKREDFTYNNTNEYNEIMQLNGNLYDPICSENSPRKLLISQISKEYVDTNTSEKLVTK